MRLARRHKIPCCVAHHTKFEGLADIYWHPLAAGTCCRILRLASNWVVRRADLVVTMNADSLQDAQVRGARRIRKMGTPLASSFVQIPQRPLSMQPPRILFLGRLAAEKGIEEMLAAAQGVPQFEFCIVGDGPLRKKVEREAARLANLRYVGWLTRSQVVQAIDEADIVALPSRLETFGTVALEALARGCFVLVSRECGIVDWPALASGLFFIEEGENLAAALRRFVALDPHQRDAIARRGWDAVRLLNEETLQGWLDVLVEMTEGNAQRNK